MNGFNWLVLGLGSIAVAVDKFLLRSLTPSYDVDAKVSRTILWRRKKER